MTAEDFRVQSICWTRWNNMMLRHYTKLFMDPFNIDPPPPKHPKDVIPLIHFLRDSRQLLRSARKRGVLFHMAQAPIPVKK